MSTQPTEHPEPECRCVNLKTAMRYGLEGLEPPHCPTHDAPTEISTSTPLALNDDAGLKAIIGRALGADTTSSTYATENQP